MAELQLVNVQLNAAEIEGLREYVTWHGAAHAEDCPKDDTCSCVAKSLNDAINSICQKAFDAQVHAAARRAAPREPQEDELALATARSADLVKRLRELVFAFAGPAPGDAETLTLQEIQDTFHCLQAAADYLDRWPTLAADECLQQRALGHGDGQQHAIDDVNAGRIDDLIAPRLAQAADAAALALQAHNQPKELLYADGLSRSGQLEPSRAGMEVSGDAPGRERSAISRGAGEPCAVEGSNRSARDSHGQGLASVERAREGGVTDSLSADLALQARQEPDPINSQERRLEFRGSDVDTQRIRVVTAHLSDFAGDFVCVYHSHGDDSVTHMLFTNSEARYLATVLQRILKEWAK